MSAIVNCVCVLQRRVIQSDDEDNRSGERKNKVQKVTTIKSLFYVILISSQKEAAWKYAVCCGMFFLECLLQKFCAEETGILLDAFVLNALLIWRESTEIEDFRDIILRNRISDLQCAFLLSRCPCKSMCCVTPP